MYFRTIAIYIAIYMILIQLKSKRKKKRSQKQLNDDADEHESYFILVAERQTNERKTIVT